MLTGVCTLLELCMMMMTVRGHDCPEGWFGHNCKLRCHCNNVTACSEFGKCLDVPECKIPYFGPLCQYVDLLAYDGSYGNDLYLVDHNDSTCNPSVDAQSVSVCLNHSYPFSWLRVITNSAISNLKFIVTFNDDDDLCKAEQRFNSSRRAIDVFCRMDATVHMLHIMGDIVPHICSVYISGGLDLVVEEVLYTRGNLTVILEADEADYHMAFNSDDNCTLTGGTEFGSEWLIEYSHQVVLRFVHIIFAQSTADVLAGLTLHTFDSNQNLISNFSQEDVNPQDVIIITFNTSELITSLAVSFDVNNSTLELCSVEAFGDIRCPEGTFGLHCEGSCNCDKSRVCNPVTGECALQCDSGFYGPGCYLGCSHQCLATTCHAVTGACFHCMPGYMGGNCTTECLAGKYGVDCEYNCSKNCAEVCDRVNGNCTCLSGFDGLTCTECQIGLYGQRCNMSCPEKCYNHRCDRELGTCQHCLPGTVGPQCADCVAGRYGPNCTFNCSRNCVNTCHHVYGYCTCQDGYREPYCQVDSIPSACASLQGGEQHLQSSTHVRGRPDCTDQCVPAAGTSTECVAGFYGDKCAQQCPELCKDGVCAKTTGYCLDCDQWRLGVLCEVERRVSVWIYVAAAVLLMVVSGPLIYCSCRPKPRSTGHDNIQLRDDDSYF